MTRTRPIRVLVALLATIVAGQGLELPSTASRAASHSRGQRARSTQNVRPRAGSVLKALQVERDLAPPGDKAGDPSAEQAVATIFDPVFSAREPARPTVLKHFSDFLPGLTLARAPPSLAI